MLHLSFRFKGLGNCVSNCPLVLLRFGRPQMLIITFDLMLLRVINWITVYKRFRISSLIAFNIISLKTTLHYNTQKSLFFFLVWIILQKDPNACHEIEKKILMILIQEFFKLWFKNLQWTSSMVSIKICILFSLRSISVVSLF